MYSGRRGIKTDSQAERVKEREREREKETDTQQKITFGCMRVEKSKTGKTGNRKIE